MSQDSLYEIQNVHQVRGEPRRRWFFSHEMDLIVWVDDEDRPLSFQLAYDKHRRIERVIRWSAENGYTHHRVTEEQRPSAGSALLVPDGAFDAARVRSQFLALSPSLPWVITELVASRLRAYPAGRAQDRDAEMLTLAVFVAVPLAILAWLVVPRRRRQRDRD